MTGTQKRWLVRNPLSVSGNGEMRHRSKTAAYEHVHEIALALRPDARTGVSVRVYVDEGNGWQLYEVVKLDELPVGRRTSRGEQ